MVEGGSKQSETGRWCGPCVHGPHHFDYIGEGRFTILNSVRTILNIQFLPFINVLSLAIPLSEIA